MSGNQHVSLRIYQLTALNVQGLTALKWLRCDSNRLNADAFKKLFADLPVRADSVNTKCWLYTEETGVTEGNHTNFTAPSDLAATFNNAKTVKKWSISGVSHQACERYRPHNYGVSSRAGERYPLKRSKGL